MELDLSRLREMHPNLSLSTALEYENRAAVGLARHGHASGTRLHVVIDDQPRQDRLHWREAPPSAHLHLDFNRVTEDAAEAVAMVLVHASRGWTILRRLQRREKGDWLLADAHQHHIALKISGVDGIDTGDRRLREKMQQVAQSKIRGLKAACVVELTPPRSRLKSA
jgi:hypothetical protein